MLNALKNNEIEAFEVKPIIGLVDSISIFTKTKKIIWLRNLSYVSCYNFLSTDLFSPTLLYQKTALISQSGFRFWVCIFL